MRDAATYPCPYLTGVVGTGNVLEEEAMRNAVAFVLTVRAQLGL